MVLSQTSSTFESHLFLALWYSQSLFRRSESWPFFIQTILRHKVATQVDEKFFDTDIEEVETAVREEIEGPGQLLGYRAMHKKLREQHNLAVPRDLVHDVMGLVDPEGLQCRGDVGKKKRRRGATGTFTSLVRLLSF